MLGMIHHPRGPPIRAKTWLEMAFIPLSPFSPVRFIDHLLANIFLIIGHMKRSDLSRRGVSKTNVGAEQCSAVLAVLVAAAAACTVSHSTRAPPPWSAVVLSGFCFPGPLMVRPRAQIYPELWEGSGQTNPVHAWISQIGDAFSKRMRSGARITPHLSRAPPARKECLIPGEDSLRGHDFRKVPRVANRRIRIKRQSGELAAPIPSVFLLYLFRERNWIPFNTRNFLFSLILSICLSHDRGTRNIALEKQTSP